MHASRLRGPGPKGNTRFFAVVLLGRARAPGRAWDCHPTGRGASHAVVCVTSAQGLGDGARAVRPGGPLLTSGAACATFVGLLLRRWFDSGGHARPPGVRAGGSGRAQAGSTPLPRPAQCGRMALAAAWRPAQCLRACAVRVGRPPERRMYAGLVGVRVLREHSVLRPVWPGRAICARCGRTSTTCLLREFPQMRGKIPSGGGHRRGASSKFWRWRWGG